MASSSDASADMKRIEAFLTSVNLFGGLHVHELRRLLAGAMVIDAAAGSAVLRRGERCLGLYVVLSGEIKLSLCGDDKPDKVIGLMRQGQVFGEAAFLPGSTTVLNVECVADSKLLLIAYATVSRELDANPRFGRNLLSHVAGRLRDMVLDIESYTRFNASERVMNYLLRSVPDADTQEAHCIVLDSKKRLIASQLSLTHEHFSRVLQELSQAKLIRVHGREVTIPSVQRLRDRVKIRAQKPEAASVQPRARRRPAQSARAVVRPERGSARLSRPS